MKALVIIILVLSVLMLVPIGVDGGYDGKNLQLYARLGLINIRIFPQKKKKRIKVNKAVRKKEEKPKKPQKPKKPKEKKSFGKEEIFGLIKMGLAALGRFRKKLCIDYLRLRYTHAANDPCDAAIGYGIASAVMGTIIPPLEAAFDIRERDFATAVSFVTEKPTIDFWLTATIQVWEIFYICAAFLADFIKLKNKQKNKNADERKECNGQTPN
ncbi:MAG: DUF2953 domain-containing protein [Oscillospiraceae bacterium]